MPKVGQDCCQYCKTAFLNLISLTSNKPWIKQIPLHFSRLCTTNTFRLEAYSCKMISNDKREWKKSMKCPGATEPETLLVFFQPYFEIWI